MKNNTMIIADESLKKLPVEIYPKIKHTILGIEKFYCFAPMVVAHKDRDMADKMIRKMDSAGSYNRDTSILAQLVYTFYNYSDKIAFTEKGNDVYTEIFSAEEKPKVFKHFLENKLSEKDYQVVEELWGELHGKTDKLAKEYISILEQTTYPMLPDLYELPKSARKNLLKNASSLGYLEVYDKIDECYFHGFTREEVNKCLSTWKEEDIVDLLKNTQPSLLTQAELQSFSGQADFFKSNLDLYSASFLQKKFSDVDKKKEFIGNRTHRSNRDAYEILQRKLNNANPY